MSVVGALQVTKYVEREILNHRVLMHPHIVQFKEVTSSSSSRLAAFYCTRTLLLATVKMVSLKEPAAAACLHFSFECSLHPHACLFGTSPCLPHLKPQLCCRSS